MLAHVLRQRHFTLVVLAAVNGGEERDDGGEEGSLQDAVTHLQIILGVEDRVAAGETLLQGFWRRERGGGRVKGHSLALSFQK